MMYSAEGTTKTEFISGSERSYIFVSVNPARLVVDM